MTEEAELAAETSVSRSGNATENGKYCDNLMPDNGDAESAASAPSYDAASKRVPIDTLARLFPHVKRSVLKFTLDKCSGDVLRAIEQLVYHNNPHYGGTQSHILQYLVLYVLLFTQSGPVSHKLTKILC